MNIQTINPSTGLVLNSYSEMKLADVNEIINASDAAFQQWSQTSFAERSEKLLKIADILAKNKKEYAQLITQEMGKPILASIAEIEKCQWVCRYYAEQTEELLAPRLIATQKSKSWVVYRPLGVIFAIMPWNFPFWQVFRFAAPNLMIGNAILLNHAPNSTGAGLALEEIFQQVGLPENLFRTLIIDHSTAAEVIKHNKIQGVTLTGSPRAGAIVGGAAANALKKVVLELGGNDPYIVLEDANLANAAKLCVASRLNNSGQVCIAAKRIIVVDAVRQQFEKLVLEELKNYRMGDPMDTAVNLGPLARADLRDNVHRQVMDCVEQGATLLVGGKIPNQPGYYYPITVLNNIKAGMTAMKEEIFGPVIALINAKDEAEAIELANASDYGLAAAVFTENIQRGEDIAVNKIHVGTCAINDLVSSDPRLPFGGIKKSGFGRELGEEGLREFANIKTIFIK